MPKFRVKSRNEKGDVFEEVSTYSSKLEAIDSVILRGLIPIEVKKEFKIDVNNIILTKTVSNSKVADFLELLSDTISSGLSLTDGTDEALKSTKSGYMLVVLEGLDKDIKRGSQLSDALAKYPTVFSESDVNLIRAGEKTGRTEEVLNKISENKRKSGEFKNALITSLIYPGVILLMALVVIWILVVYLVPTVSDMYTQLDGELPQITIFVVTITTKIASNYIICIFLLFLLIVGIVIAWRVEVIRYKLDRIIIKIWFIGNLVQMYETYKVCFVLHSLIEGGVASNKALDIASRVVTNKFISKEITDVRLDVESNGISLSEAFRKTEHVMPIFIQTISAGERTGEITDKLLKLSLRLDKSLSKYLNMIKSTISPVLIAILAIFIGVLLFAVMSPMYSIIDYI